MSKPLKLSILDQSPIAEGNDFASALRNTIALAQLGDRLGYQRIWIAEHHAMGALASPAPEILLARLTGETERIRLGSGGVMLPHYSPLKVAEVFSMLNAMAPGRIDLGLGRAPGGGAIEMLALRRERSRSPMPDDFVEQVSELIAYLERRFSGDHPFAGIPMATHTPPASIIWLLGSSMWSAQAAAQWGVPYAFAHFFGAGDTTEAIATYQRYFQPSSWHSAPQAMAAVGVICAETDAEAQHLAASVRLLRRRLRQGKPLPIAPPDAALAELGPQAVTAPGERTRWPTYFIGRPDDVRSQLQAFAEALGIEELMVVTVTHDQAAKHRSYELLADAFGIR